MLKTAIKKTLAPILYRHYPIGLSPARFHLWLDCLRKTNGVDGTVMEIGVSAGGTAAFSRNYLRELGDDRPYLCVDTFSGFVKEQFDKDVSLGNTKRSMRSFSANSIDLVRRVLDLHQATDVRLVKADISKMPLSEMPASVSACLLDVDLAVPVYDGLKLVWPRLARGGIIMVDDCQEGDGWQALVGVRQFAAEFGVQPQLQHGAALLSADNR